MTGQTLESLFTEYFSDQAHGFFEVKAFTVRGTDSGTFLTSVLQSIKTKVCKICRFLVAVNAEYTALFMDIMEQRPGAADMFFSIQAVDSSSKEWWWLLE